jgi:signal transduction histidine kinase
MISGMRSLAARLTSGGDAGPSSRRLTAVLAGLAGCLFLVVGTSSQAGTTGLPPFLTAPALDRDGGPASLQGWVVLVAPVVATALGLCLLRWWPYLLTLAGLLAVPGVIAEWHSFPYYPWVFELLVPSVGYALAIVSLLACAQGLIRTAAGWGAALAALTMGSRLLGSAMPVPEPWYWSLPPHTAACWDTGLLAAGLAMVVRALWLYRRGEPGAAGPASSRRVRLVTAGTLAAAVSIPLAFLTTQRMADLLGVAWYTLARHSVAQMAVIGAFTLVTATLLAALAGLWPLAGAMTAAVVQVAVIAPVILTLSALYRDNPLRWLAALAGAALGAAVAGSRWRVPMAAALTVLAAMGLFIAYAATTGNPEELASQNIVIPSVLILVACAAAASAVVGATAPVLAARGALPAVIGPLAGTLAIGGLQATQVLSVSDGGPVPANPEIMSALLLLVAGAAIGGVGFAQLLTTRRTERKHAEQIRREAATAERDRLGRSIHDGVLQVLTLVQRQGPALGTQGGELAALAGEQEAALRGLLAGEASTSAVAAGDLRGPLQSLAAPAVEIATPAQAVELPAGVAAEVVAAVRAALDNVRRHAGAHARAWILLEDEKDGVRVTVRDNGVGFPPQRLAEAAAAGRLGIAQSMRGRIADCGGTTTIDSQPGKGTEVEFWIPRTLRARG